MTESPNLTDRSSFQHWATENVRYGDTDRQGHVNNAVYATYSESGRSAFLRSPSLAAFPAGSVVALVSITNYFRAEVFWPNKVDVGTTVLSVGRTSVTFGQGMFTDDGCVAASRNTVVLIDQKTRRPKPLPEEFRRALAEVRTRTDESDEQSSQSEI
jgi:acyl-CoA thioester hydrolase